MDNHKENLQNEPGSMQRQTQGDQPYDGTTPEQTAADEQDKFGIVPAPQAKGSDADVDKNGSANLNDDDDDKPNLEDIDDEKIIPGIGGKRSFWNSITFDNDDFFGGLAPA